jgi:hypothetical protein
MRSVMILIDALAYHWLGHVNGTKMGHVEYITYVVRSMHFPGVGLTTSQYAEIGMHDKVDVNSVTMPQAMQMPRTMRIGVRISLKVKIR